MYYAYICVHFLVGKCLLSLGIELLSHRMCVV